MTKNKNLIFGINPVFEAIDSGKEIEKVFIKNNLGNERINQIVKEMRNREIPLQYVPIQKLNKITSKNHQGIIAFVSEIEYTKLDSLIPMLFEKGKSPLLLILDGVTDVRNFGSIARSAECAGIDAIIIPAKGSAGVNSDSIRTSSGALFSLPIVRTSDLEASLMYIKNSGIQVYGASEKSEEMLYTIDFTIPCAIVMGSEYSGIQNRIDKYIDRFVKIPIFGTIESLNVSVAASIFVYEAVRQRITIK